MRYLNVVLLILVAVLIGCSEDNPVEPAPKPVPYYPNQVGMYWVFEAYDSVRATTDTVTITIADTLTLPGMNKAASLWTWDLHNKWLGLDWDTLYVLFDGVDKSSEKDTIDVYWWREGFDPWRKWFYVFPLAVDDYWTNHDAGLMWDSTHIFEVTDVVTPAGKFTDCYRLVEEYSCGDECSAFHTYWYKPGVGIVKSHRREWDIFDYPDAPQLVATLELIEYHVE